MSLRNNGINPNHVPGSGGVVPGSIKMLSSVFFFIILKTKSDESAKIVRFIRKIISKIITPPPTTQETPFTTIETPFLTIETSFIAIETSLTTLNTSIQR